MVFTNYYKTLGIAFDASDADIKSAYRSMSKRFHPDVNEGDAYFEDRFKDVQEAYGVLSDPKSRSLYDKVFKKYRTEGFASGNTILIPDESAGKSAFSWHPDYRATKQNKPLTRRSAMLIGLAVILVVGFCTWALQQRDPKSLTNVVDADLYVGTSQRSRVIAEKKQPKPVRSSARVYADTTSIRLTALAAGSPGGFAVKTPAQIPLLKPIKSATAQPIPVPRQAPNEADALRTPGTPPDALLASSGKMFVGRPASVPAAMLLPPERVAIANPVVSRKDTDGTDLMVRRVRDVRYGYSVVLIRRTYHFKDRRPDQSRMIRYGSNVLLFKLSDLADKDALLRKAVTVYSRMESTFTFTETFTATSEILDQALKTFDTHAEAIAALKMEAIAMSVRM